MEITKQAIKYTFPLFFIFFISCSEQKKDVIKEELETIVPKIIYNKIHGFSEENYVFDSSVVRNGDCLLYTSPSPRDTLLSRMPSSA